MKYRVTLFATKGDKYEERKPVDVLADSMSDACDVTAPMRGDIVVVKEKSDLFPDLNRCAFFIFTTNEGFIALDASLA